MPLPEGGDPRPLQRSGLDRLLTETLKHARTVGHVRFNPEARQAWIDVYPRLTTPAPGLAGALTARAEAHTIRLALLYALLDGQTQIQPQHLTAALALSDYTTRSARWALGAATGDQLAEQIHAALTHHPDGLTRTQLRDLFQRHQPAHRVEQALNALAGTGRANQTRIITTGRPAELWTATQPA